MREGAWKDILPLSCGLRVGDENTMKVIFRKMGEEALQCLPTLQTVNTPRSCLHHSIQYVYSDELKAELHAYHSLSQCIP